MSLHSNNTKFSKNRSLLRITGARYLNFCDLFGACPPRTGVAYSDSFATLSSATQRSLGKKYLNHKKANKFAVFLDQITPLPALFDDVVVGFDRHKLTVEL